MKIILYFLFILPLALARPQNDVRIVAYNSRNLGDGSYEFSYELSDGTKRQESGYLDNSVAGEEPSLNVVGSYSYISPDGKVIEQNYRADRGGFQPQTGAKPARPPAVATAFASPLSIARGVLNG